MDQKPFTGTGVALVTPFKKDYSVDFAALENIVSYVIKGGVDYLVALGTTGETPTLTPAEKQEILAAIIRFAAGRVPVVCGAGGNSTAEVVHQVREISALDIAGILSVSPYYNRPTQEGIYQHFSAVAAATDKPVILYNVPGRTGSNVLPATVLRLAQAHKNIVAIKDAAGSIPQSMETILGRTDSFTVISGDDNLILAQMAIGMEGVISVAANCFTREMTDIVNLATVGKFDKARKVLYRILPGIDLLFAEGNPGGVKAVLSHMGLCENVLRLPLVPVSEATQQKIGHFLKNLHG